MHTLQQNIRHYHLEQLSDSEIAANPICKFLLWLKQAYAQESREPNAMTLATSSHTGQPAARIVLLKAVEHQQFIFFSNYESRKGEEISQNPHVALLFWWPNQERQIRIEGSIDKISQEQSESYFQSRPRGSQIGAHASQQSQPLSSRKLLEDKVQQLTQHYKRESTIPRPEYWGGYAVTPEVIEFWQGQPDRLHDRIRYERKADRQWSSTYLYP
jgi:pyridoxamine 5'-phosphate oxidase